MQAQPPEDELAAKEQAQLLKRLREVAHDAQRAGASLQEVHQALSLVRAEINTDLGYSVRSISPYPEEPSYEALTLPCDGD